MKIKSQKDFFAGLMFMGVGVAFAWGATTYNVGTGARMGPGYFPLMLGILLAFIGGKMLWEAFTEDEDEGDGKDAEKIDLGEYLILAIATSIDALAVGISFAALSVDIVPAVSLIGITTFIFSVAGVAIGHTFGARYEKPATIVGGVVLILIGLKILLEHLGILAL